MSSSRDKEITLGVGKLLGLFFALIALCGLSLGIGYWMGRYSALRATAHAPGAEAAVPASAAATQANAANAGAETGSAKSSDQADSSDMTFYQAVQQSNPQPKLTPPGSPAAKAPAKPATLGGGYLVQIAAVSRASDAKLLQTELEKKHYPVIITTPGDKLYHVQVGPYADLKEAKEIRSRLINAGYRPFLKH